MSEVTVEQIAETEDTGEPVFRAEYRDAWMDFLFPSKREQDVWVHMVRSPGKGGMKQILDHVCREYECRSIRFVNVINDSLADSLDGFEWVEDTIEEPHPSAGETIRCLQGEWDT